MKLAVNESRLEAKMCRQSYEFFAKSFWGEVPGSGQVVWNWHMSLICDELQVAAERVFRWEPRPYDLVFNVPFGTSKSTLISILFPNWVWTRFPEARFITSSHTDNLVMDLSSKSRWVVKGEKYRAYFPEIEIKADQDTKGYYVNTAGGCRLVCTVGGKTPTGFHAHFVLNDDPIDPQGARSEAELETASKFMQEVIPSRVVDKQVALSVLIMQRLHYRDPTAVAMEVSRREGATPVRHICLPGEVTEDLKPSLEWLRERYGQQVYAEDGLLDPVRLPRVVLRKYAATLGAYGYAGQVLQKPSPPGGGMFNVKWFNSRVKAAPYHAKRIRYWDKAATQDGGCYTAGVLIAKDKEGSYFVEHVVHGQWETNERENRILATALRDRSRYGPNNVPVIYVEHEPGSGGVDSFRGTVRKLAGFVVMPDRPTGSKDARAEPWSSQLAAGNVAIVDDGSWDVAGYVQEHELFRPDPGSGKRVGKYKDQVDASSGAFNLLANAKLAGTVRVLPIRVREGKDQQLRLVVCSTEELASLMVEVKCLLVRIEDPLLVEEPLIVEEGVMRNGSYSETDFANGRVDVNGAGGTRQTGGVLESLAGPSFSGHCLQEMLDSLTLRFADLDPADYQETWEESLPAFGVPAHSVAFSKDQAKSLWKFLLKKRDQGPGAIIVADLGDRRAMSVACGIADALRLPRQSIHQVADPDYKVEGLAPNKFVYDLVKIGRGTVVS